MHYVMSDLHGRYDKYQKMLETIGFCDGDTMYILGDFVDRGPDGIRILQDVMKRPNVEAVIGNHDWTMMRLIADYPVLVEKMGKEQVLGLFRLWFSDGGLPTYRQIKNLSERDRHELLYYVSFMHYYVDVTVNSRRFFMAHTVPEYDADKPLTEHPAEDFIHGEPDYDVEYDSGTYIVTGHTPTDLIDPKCKGRIWQGNGHIAIDCGAGFGGPLGCLRLEDMAEFYV